MRGVCSSGTPRLPASIASMKSITPILVLLVILTNLPLIVGMPAKQLMLDPAAAAAGEWWRLITHPFVHAGWYHLVLDAGAFFLLWSCRKKPARTTHDAFVISVTATGSALAAMSSGIPAGGFCGLSGVAHGLMTYQGAGFIKESDRTNRIIGWIVIIAVIGKSVLEIIRGSVLFAELHPGYLGSPVVACHLGGCLGGLVAGFRSSRASGKK